MNNTLSRRKFLALSGAVVAAGNLSIPGRKSFASGVKSRISISDGADDQTLINALATFGGIEKFVTENSVVVLKPNISFPNPPEWGTTTSPWLVKSVTELCLEAGAKKVIIADNPLGTSPENNLKRSGIGESVAGMDKVNVMMLSEQRKYLAKSLPSEQLKTVETARILEKADVLINLPTAKAHTETGVSLGLKNLMGLIWDRKVFHQKYNLELAIAELALYLRPQLTIMDVSRALLNNGPMGPGRVEKVNKIVAGIDPVAVDSITLNLANFNLRKMNYHQVPHIEYAEKIGIGNANPDNIEVNVV
ncbi:MAG: DUF362 domain-containing protein [FCB group bacterium]|nr:DUF362 domain-containing protein [FCB group bacterium]